jgi:hypothetical protein
MSDQARNYTTWEEDFLSDRSELHGYKGELVAVIDKVGKEWVLQDRNGNEVARRHHKADIVHLAEQLL